jgi:hypothetical protein
MAAFDALCPHCRARLTIDPGLKAIIDSKPADEPRTFDDLDAAVGHLKAHDSERESKFLASMEAEKGKKQVLERKFDELFKKASEDDRPLIREIDLD